MGRYITAGIGGSNIADPFPTVIKGKKLRQRGGVPAAFPHPANDGSTIALDAAGTVTIYNAANTLLYTMTAANINASATAIAMVWLDTVDGVVWAVAKNATAGQGYLGKINYTTGVVTAVGAGFAGQVNTLPTASSLNYMLERASMGAGDLTLWFSGANTYKFSLSTATGLVTVAESLVQSDSTIAINGLKYHTLDQTLFCDITGSGSDSTLNLIRNGTQLTINFDSSGVGGIGAITGNPRIFPWGSDALWLTPVNASSVEFGTQSFTRSSFDAWLQRIATSAGVP